MSGGLAEPLNNVASGALGQVWTLLSGSFWTVVYSIIALVLLFLVIGFFKKAISGGNN